MAETTPSSAGASPPSGQNPRGPADFERAADGRAEAAASFESRDASAFTRISHILHANPTFVPVLVLVLGCLFFGVATYTAERGSTFFTPFNLSLIIQQVTIIGFLAAAQSLVILTAGIDLSVAAVMVLSYMVMGRLSVDAGIPTPIALMLGMMVGLAAGLFNGMLVTRLRIAPIIAAVLVWVAWLGIAEDAEIAKIYAVPIGFAAAVVVGAILSRPSIELRLPPFIVTLGAWLIFFAMNIWYSSAQTIRSQDIDQAAPLLKLFGERISIYGAVFTYASFLMIVVFFALWYALNWTSWGRAVYAVGDDKEAAELSGINTDRILLSVYGLAGLICALGGWAAISRVGSASPQSFYEGNLNAITAVVIGGISLFGGRGAIFGALFGALIVGMFRSGINQMGFDPIWQEFAVGLLIIVAVSIDQWIRKASA